MAPLRIGFVSTLSGRDSRMGIDERRGVTLAVEEINQGGGIPLPDGRLKPIELLIEDDLGTADGARAAVERQIDNGVDAIIGLQTSGLTAAGLEIAQKHEVVMISPSATSKVFSAQDDYFFRVVNSTLEEADSIAGYLVRRGLSPLAKVGIVLDVSNAVYTRAWADDMYDALVSRIGGLHYERVEFNSQEDVPRVDHARIIRKFGDLSSYNTLIFATGALDGAFFAQVVDRAGYRGALVGSRWAKSMDLIYTGGPAVEGMIFSEMYDPSLESEEFLNFHLRFRKRFGDEPNFASVHGYEAVLYLVAGLQLLDGADLEGPISGPLLKEAMSRVGSFSGVIFEINVDRFGEASRPQILQRISNQGYERIDE